MAPICKIFRQYCPIKQLRTTILVWLWRNCRKIAHVSDSTEGLLERGSAGRWPVERDRATTTLKFARFTVALPVNEEDSFVQYHFLSNETYSFWVGIWNKQTLFLLSTTTHVRNVSSTIVRWNKGAQSMTGLCIGTTGSFCVPNLF